MNPSKMFMHNPLLLQIFSFYHKEKVLEELVQKCKYMFRDLVKCGECVP